MPNPNVLFDVTEREKEEGGGGVVLLANRVCLDRIGREQTGKAGRGLEGKKRKEERFKHTKHSHRIKDVLGLGCPQKSPGVP